MKKNNSFYNFWKFCNWGTKYYSLINLEGEVLSFECKKAKCKICQKLRGKIYLTLKKTNDKLFQIWCYGIFLFN